MSLADSPPAPHPSVPASRLRSLALLLLLWTLIGLSFASQFYLSSARSGNPISWAEALSYAMADWYVWALLSFIPLQLSKRFPLERIRWSNNLLIHLTASLATALLYAFLRAAIAQAQIWSIGDYASFAEVVQPLLFKTYHFNLIVYCVIAAIAHAIRYYQKFNQHERAAIDLERRLTEARLLALQNQLNPHFLFNAMHSISALMHQDVDAADSMLARLSELLRLTLKNDKSQTIPLADELQMLERYLDIERIRFGDRLTTEFQIDPAALPLHVPCLILQPLVENALKHGIAPYARPGKVTISATLADDQLTLQVTDNGGGLSPDRREGIGLTNTQTRLAELYGEQQTFTIAPHPNSGTQVTITLPT